MIIIIAQENSTCSQPVGDGQCRVIDTVPRWRSFIVPDQTAPAFPFRVFYSFQADESAIGLPGIQNHIEMFLAVRVQIFPVRLPLPLLSYTTLKAADRKAKFFCVHWHALLSALYARQTALYKIFKNRIIKFWFPCSITFITFRHKYDHALSCPCQ